MTEGSGGGGLPPGMNYLSPEWQAKLAGLAQEALSKQQAKGPGKILWDVYAPGRSAGPGGYVPNQPSMVPKPVVYNEDQALQKLSSYWGDDAKRNQMTVDLYRAGFIYNSAGIGKYSSFINAGSEAMIAYQNDTSRSPNEPYTAWLARQASKSDRSMPGMDAGSGGGSGGGSASVVNLTNQFDAEVLVNNALNQYLGRDATEQEVDEFYKKLNRQERNNPRVATPGGSGGGFNSQLFAEEFAQQDSEYADVTADVTLKNLMSDAIRGRMSGTVEGML